MKIRQIGGQFFRYSIIGIINSVVSMGVLNLLAWFTHIYKGPLLVMFYAIAFTVGVSNSYLLNRSWTFKTGKGSPARYPLFYALTLIGFGIGSAIIFVMTTYIPAPRGLSAPAWLNVANVVATGICVLWNFTAYRQVVFQQPAGANH